MEIMDTCFCEESFIDRSFLVLEILRRRHKTLYKTKKPMVSRVKNAIIVRLFLLQLSFAYNPPFYFNMEKSYKDIYHFPIIITVIRFARYYLLFASNRTFMTDAMFLGTIRIC